MSDDEPEIDPDEGELVEAFVWNGITVLARYRSNYLVMGYAHLELHVPSRQHIPVTDTGYRSHFHQPGEVEKAGGPAAYAKAWLDQEAKKPEWRRKDQQRRQLDLFD